MNFPPNSDGRPQTRRHAYPEGVEEEVIACFWPSDIPQFHTGKLQSFIFGETRKTAYRRHIPVLVCRVFAWNLHGSALIEQQALSFPVSGGQFGASAAGHIRYHQHIDFEYVQQEAWRELAEETGPPLIYGRFYDFHLEQTSSGNLRGVYTFVALVKNELHPNPQEAGPNTQFVAATALNSFLDRHPFIRICKQYWAQLDKEGLWGALMREHQGAHHLHPSAVSPRPLPVAELGNPQGEIGLVIGRFQPFHNGHLQFFLDCLDRVGHLKVGIGSAQYHSTADNPFTAQERVEMVDRTLCDCNFSPDRYSIYPIPDLHNADLWASRVVELVGEFTVFFSNSEWTRQLFFKAGKALGKINKYKFATYNGTQIRARYFRGESIEQLVPPAVNKIVHRPEVRTRLESLFQ